MKYPILILVIVAMLTGCRSATPDESIDTAATALAAGDINMAADIINRAASTIGNSGASVTQLCDLALLTMQVNDIDPSLADVNTALDFYQRAVAIDRDSTEQYMLAQPLEYASMIQTLSGLDRATLIDTSTITEHEMPLDSLSYL